jgi:two-component system nitrate/nitrite response regulator NarL
MTSVSSHPMARVLVVEDDAELREVLVTWLSGVGYEVSQAADGRAALACVKRDRIDVVVTDLAMPHLSGLELLTLLDELNTGAQVIVLSGQATIETAIAAMREGRAFDFLRKPLLDLPRLRFAIDRAYMKGRGGALPPVAPDALVERLSERERELLRLLAGGLSNLAIAESLGLSEKTVRNNLSVIYEKLGVSNRTQAALMSPREEGQST